jgi:hypothetical protein
MKDELRGEIKVWLASIADYAMTNKWDGLIARIDHVADEIFSLLAPTIEKAEKWNALRESGCRCEMYNSPSCTRCNLEGGQDDKS